MARRLLNGSLGLQNNNGTTVLTSGIAATTVAVLPAVASGACYSITVASQPSKQTCSVNNGTGIVSGALVTNVTVACNERADSGSASKTASRDRARQVELARLRHPTGTTYFRQ